LSSSKTSEHLTLAEAVELIVYGASCNRCHETRRIDLAQLRDRLGPRVLVGQIRRRLRCSKCGNRRIIVVTLCRAVPHDRQESRELDALGAVACGIGVSWSALEVERCAPLTSGRA
jgi:hypothetical protein